MTPVPDNSQALRIIGTPVLKGGSYVLNEYAIVNRECGWICPHCYREVRIRPTQPGQQTFYCGVCGTPFSLMVDAEASTFMPKKRKAAMGFILKPTGAAPGKPEAPVAPVKPEAPAESATVAIGGARPAQPGKETSAQLQWGGFFSKKRYTLWEGANIIGREDKKNPSDLEFPDPEMSRRSVKITATPNGRGGHIFNITVLKALNPVKLNGQVLAIGVEVPLRNGNTITMGNTTMTFKV